MFHQTPLKTAAILILLSAGVLYGVFTGYFGRELLMEIAILAIVAISLDIVAGYGGMISLCHGALYGIGAYAFAAATVHGELGAPVGMGMAILAAVIFAAFVGAVTARTEGIFFIMATLAFGQMVYEWVFKSTDFGGDDGLPGVPRLDLSAVGIDLFDSLYFALFCLLCTGLAYGVAAGLLRSGFGRTLVGIRANEARMRALGLPVWRYKALAFAASGALAGLAGALAAQHTMYVSPQLLYWTVSGEVLVIVILGGLGTLIGPVLGAAILVLLRHEVQSYTDHWHIIVGLVLIAAVLLGGRGVYGELEHRLGRRKTPASSAAEQEPSHA
ncbi:MAG: branched-chain amino acid ABC transporter permease [Pseudomonadota bacterium]